MRGLLRSVLACTRNRRFLAQGREDVGTSEGSKLARGGFHFLYGPRSGKGGWFAVSCVLLLSPRTECDVMCVPPLFCHPCNVVIFELLPSPRVYLILQRPGLVPVVSGGARH